MLEEFTKMIHCLPEEEQRRAAALPNGIIRKHELVASVRVRA
jgi:hypothetical protein